MAKKDCAIIKETKYMIFLVTFFSIVMEAIFLAFGKWDYTVLLGNILSAGAMVLNFFFMGVSIEKTLEVDPKYTKKIMLFSQSIRSILLFLVISLGVLLSMFDTVSVVLPVFFPRLALALRPCFFKKERGAA